MKRNGVLVIDKPEGPTSFDVVARVRKALHTKEVGHCGTLDPLATGVVVVCVGSYTRLVRVLSADDKRYTATIAFGTSTTTDDREGEIVERADAARLATLTERDVRVAVASMSGVQMQVPPAYSAIHVNGERAYAKARRGEDVVMEPREVIVHGLSLLSFEGDDAGGARAVVDVHCGKGTYVRALARDIGKKVGVPAHLHALRRTVSGAYGLEDAVALDHLDERHATEALRTGTSAVRGVPLIPVSEEQAAALAQGRKVPTGVSVAGTALAHRGDTLVALVHVDAGMLVVERGFGSS